jgi:protein-L-isoaspartate(D-aspartate) O-methyltransferase
MADMNIEQARHNMIEQQIRPWDVLDQRVLDRILHTPREDFVPTAYRGAAFTDMMLPIGHGEVMMEPKLEARMLQALAIQPGDKVLEVGTGSAYVTALLAGMAAQVVSVEIDAELHKQAKTLLARHGIENVALEQGDAAGGWGAHQPYNVIAITGSLPALPQSFKESMQIGGRLFAVIGSEPMMEAVLVTRLNANEWREEILFETLLPPLRNTSKEKVFSF